MDHFALQLGQPLAPSLVQVRECVLLESELVKSALKRTQGNQTRAAELLGLSRFGLQKMIKRLQIGAD